MKVAGIDYSSRCVDIVTVDLDGHDPPEWSSHQLEGKDAFDRTRTVALALPGRASTYWDDILAVGIEHPGGHYGTRELLRVQGAILARIPTRMLVHPLPPTRWKYLIGLKGNATKDEVAEWVTWQGGGGSATLRWSQDACDAYCIALATLEKMAIVTA